MTNIIINQIPYLTEVCIVKFCSHNKIYVTRKMDQGKFHLNYPTYSKYGKNCNPLEFDCQLEQCLLTVNCIMTKSHMSSSRQE